MQTRRSAAPGAPRPSAHCTARRRPGRGPQGGPARPPSLPAVGSFRHEPGPGDADEAPERGEDDDRQGEGMSRHGRERDAQAGAQGRTADARARGVPAGQWAPSMRSTTGRPRGARTVAPAQARARHCGGGGLAERPDLVSFGQLLISFDPRDLQDRGMCRNKLCFIQVAKG